MSEEFPKNSEEFNRLMLEIDKHLVSAGQGIPSRPIASLQEIAKRFSLLLPITEPPPNANYSDRKLWRTSVRVYDWYDKRYGERLKVNFSPGGMVIIVENDLWILRIPRIYGNVKLIVSRETKSSRKPSINNKTPYVYNVVESIQKMTWGRITSLPNNELELIYQKFILGLQAFSILEASSSEHELLKSAIADIGASVDHLMKSPSQYGLSKWSSLQATEKVFKAAISLSGGKFKTTHDLSKLSKQADQIGISNRWSTLIPYIQCTPSIRYGDETCSRDEAILAHHCSLALIVQIYSGGAKFKSDMALSLSK